MGAKLRDYVENTVMKHISDVLKGFEMCEDTDDLEEYIDWIPNGFGVWSYNTDDEGFYLANYYSDKNFGEQEEETYFLWAKN